VTVADDLAARLAAGDVIVLDGGMGTELQARGVPMDDEAWSGVANLEYGDTVREIHEDYIRAGADVIIANTYAAARLPLERAGYGDRVVESNRRAVEAAIEARENVAASRPVAIAGSLSLAAATDVVLRGRPGPEGEALLEAYREQASAQKEAGVDLIALEMIMAAGWGRAAVRAAAETELPVWLGVSVDVAQNGGVPILGTQGGDLGELLDALLGPEISAVTIMHSVVEAVPRALEVVRGRFDGPIGAYPHVGDYQPPEWLFGDITPEAFAQEAKGWVAQGAQLVGGCCGIRPAHIAALRAAFPD
jgi:S-methylmethionine-dependent homocysteine/selenocysteine methylase